jgi:hypothetical protein
MCAVCDLAMWSTRTQHNQIGTAWCFLTAFVSRHVAAWRGGEACSVWCKQVVTIVRVDIVVFKVDALTYTHPHTSVVFWGRWYTHLHTCLLFLGDAGQ